LKSKHPGETSTRSIKTSLKKIKQKVDDGEIVYDVHLPKGDITDILFEDTAATPYVVDLSKETDTRGSHKAPDVVAETRGSSKAPDVVAETRGSSKAPDVVAETRGSSKAPDVERTNPVLTKSRKVPLPVPFEESSYESLSESEESVGAPQDDSSSESESVSVLQDDSSSESESVSVPQDDSSSESESVSVPQYDSLSESDG
jgi:hypothetical protein